MKKIARTKNIYNDTVEIINFKEKAIQTKNKNRTENINLEEEANEAIKRY